MKVISLVILVMLLLSLSACKCGVEEQVRIHDDLYLERVLSGLNSEQVGYRVDSSGAIRYCIDKKEVVKEILDRELKVVTSIIGFSDKASANRYRAILLKEGIESELLERGNGEAILLISPAEYEDAKRIFKRKLTKGKNVKVLKMPD
jgi:hypothetical protein